MMSDTDIELGPVDELGALEGQIAELLAADDVASLAAAMENGGTAGVSVGGPVGGFVRVGGAPCRWSPDAAGRIPIQAILVSLEAEDVPTTEGA